MVVTIGQQLFLQNAVVGQLAVKAEAEPLAFVNMLAFERLRIISIVFAAGRVADVADRGVADQLTLDRFALRSMIQAKDLGDGTDVAACLQQTWAIGVEGRHPGGELTPILDVQQHSRQQTRYLSRPVSGADRTATAAGKVVNGCDSTLVMQFTHRLGGLLRLGTNGADWESLRGKLGVG